MTPEPTRNIPIGVMAAVVAVACLAGAFWIAVFLGGWWMLAWIVLVPLGGTCAYGVHESFQKVPRDAKGNRL